MTRNDMKVEIGRLTLARDSATADNERLRALVIEQQERIIEIVADNNDLRAKIERLRAEISALREYISQRALEPKTMRHPLTHPERDDVERQLRAEYARQNTTVKRLRAEKDEAYQQRNHLVAALARLFPSGVRATSIDGWEPDWHGCVYVDLPTGQISYHYHDSQAGLFADLPPYTKLWDGHDKDVVHSRLAALTKE